MNTTPTTEEWAAAEVAADTPTPAPKGIPEDAISAKMAFGLDRDQAIAVLTAQAAADAAAAKPAKAKSK